MQSQAIIGQTAPELEVSHWVQGEASHLRELAGKVVLVEVFQVNCPGCFVHALPEASRLHNTYAQQGLQVIGVATAFEDFELNTLANLRLLVNTGELIGEPRRQLGGAGLLVDNKIDFELPFPIAMDRLSENKEAVTEDSILHFINSQVDNYAALAETHRQLIYQRASDYLHSKTHHPHSFTRYCLQGTPSSILIDRQGILRDVSFGYSHHLEAQVQSLLAA